LLAFDEQTGKFLWQHSSEKLPTGRVHDWPDQGICSAPLLDGDKVWFVTSRGEVACLDAEGFHDGEDDGPFVNEQVRVAEVQRTEPAFAPMIAALDADQVSPEMTALLAKQGANPEGDVTVQVETAKSAWKLTSKFNGIERTLSAKVMGPRLAVFKTLGVDDKDEADVIWKLDMMKQEFPSTTCAVAH
jgi:hypothetical protein